jgi:hypothetical protein
MPILVDYLSVWDISFRWAGYDPRKFYFRMPLEVENYARTLIDAIHKAELYCETITLEKMKFEKDEAKLSFYYWADDFFSMTSGKRISSELLKWAAISRFDFKLWCDRMNVPLPEFWFPKGWNLEYQINENEYHPGHSYLFKDLSEENKQEYLENLNADESDDKEIKDHFRYDQKSKIACQQIAIQLWRLDQTTTIADMVKKREIQEFGDGQRYSKDVVRRWLKEVAPQEVSARVGRPQKKNSTEE